MIFYYNCSRPLEVLQTNCIFTSKVHGGVSLSTNFHMGSHGPFKIMLQEPSLRVRLKQCLYMTPARSMPIGDESAMRRFARVVAYVDQLGNNWRPDEYQSLLAARIAKNPMFKDEQEWWSPVELRFPPTAIKRVYFMRNAPNVYPRLAAKARRELQWRWNHLYEEIQINDPYLEKASKGVPC
jgi:hypothetical protein